MPETLWPKVFLEATADLLTVWMGNMIDLLEPEVIIFGGGIAQLMSDFFPRMRLELPKWSINARCCEIPLLLAKYGSDAGIAGAAALCRQQRSSEPVTVRR